jgi:hypothetical protein
LIVAQKPAAAFGGSADIDDGLEDIALDGSPLFLSQTAPPVAPPSSIDLTGKPKLIFVAGLGQTGKTTLCRWIAERSTEREGAALASVDPVNRELGLFFSQTLKPETRDPGGIARWLDSFVATVMKERGTAVIDLGGGDASLPRLITDAPDLAQRIEAAGVAIVALYLLSGRPIDLTPLNDMERLGFQPACTAVVLNHVKLRAGVSHEAEFRLTVRHTAYRAALSRGAIPIWMPHLHTADMIRDRHILFSQAKSGVMPEDRPGLPLGPSQQSSTAGWMRAMEAACAPIDRWMP